MSINLSKLATLRFIESPSLIRNVESDVEELILTFSHHICTHGHGTAAHVKVYTKHSHKTGLKKEKEETVILV